MLGPLHMQFIVRDPAFGECSGQLPQLCEQGHFSMGLPFPVRQIHPRLTLAHLLPGPDLMHDSHR